MIDVQPPPRLLLTWAPDLVALLAERQAYNRCVWSPSMEVKQTAGSGGGKHEGSPSDAQQSPEVSGRFFGDCHH